MPDVERIESAAQGAAIEPRAVMSHIIQGFQSEMIRWARERPAANLKSAHFTIGRDGRIVQHVGIRRQAWHAGRLDPGRPPVWRLLPAGGNPNNFAVGIEHEGFSGEDWPEAQILAAIRVHRWLFSELGLIPSEDTVIGHFMTAPASRAHDPGPGWPRARIIEALRSAGPVSDSSAGRVTEPAEPTEPAVDEPPTSEDPSTPEEPATPPTPPPPPIRLEQDDYETAAVKAFFGVEQHSYSVREDERWQFIEIRRPRQ